MPTEYSCYSEKENNKNVREGNNFKNEWEIQENDSRYISIFVLLDEVQNKSHIKTEESYMIK